MKKRKHIAKNTHELLNLSPALHNLVERAKNLDHLKQKFNALIQPAAQPYCYLYSCENDYLMIAITHPAWATRLRYQQARLLKQVQLVPEFSHVQRLLFKLLPEYSVEKELKPPLTITESNAKQLIKIAETIEHEPLKQSLLRLSKHTS